MKICILQNKLLMVAKECCYPQLEPGFTIKLMKGTQVMFPTGEKASATTMINNEDSSWGTPWSPNDTIILSHSNIQRQRSHHIQTCHRQMILRLHQVRQQVPSS